MKLQTRVLKALSDGAEHTGRTLVRDHGLPRVMVYVALYRLEGLGWVSSRLESRDEDALPRYAYRITEAGKAQL